MTDEYNALIAYKTWVLVPRTLDMHVIRSMRIFKHKMKSDDSFERYKARLVGYGRSHQVVVDCEEIFSLIAQPATIRMVLSLALSKSWLINQIDVKNAFLHDTLNETVCMHQPMGFRDASYPNHVYKKKTMEWLPMCEKLKKAVGGRNWLDMMIVYCREFADEHQDFSLQVKRLIGDLREACEDRIAFVRELWSVAGETVPAKIAVFLEEMMNKEGSREW
ncbi:copia protein [Tanacetum coccineum]